MTNPPPQPPEGGDPPPSEDDVRPPQGSPPPPPPGGYGPPSGFPPPQGNYPPQGGYGAPPPQGNYPPQGGYGAPPPQGGYYPPPQGGYGAPPPQGGYYPPPGAYPPPSGYGPPPQGGGYYPPPPQGNYPPYSPGGPGFGAGPEVNVGEGFSWAWNKFSKNAVAILVPTLVYAVALAVIYGVTMLVAGALAPESTSSYQSDDGGFSASFGAGYGAASIVVVIIGYLVFFVASGAVSSALYSGLLDIANGQPVEIGSFFKPRNVGSVVVASLLVGLAAFIGSLLCIIPGLVVAIFAVFTSVLIVDRNLSPIDGIKASVDVVKRNFLQALLTWLLVLVVSAVGVLACGIGALVTSPLASLYLVFAYRRLTGGQVAPHTP